MFYLLFLDITLSKAFTWIYFPQKFTCSPPPPPTMQKPQSTDREPRTHRDRCPPRASSRVGRRVRLEGTSDHPLCPLLDIRPQGKSSWKYFLLNMHDLWRNETNTVWLMKFYSTPDSTKRHRLFLQVAYSHSNSWVVRGTLPETLVFPKYNTWTNQLLVSQFC